MYGALMSRSAPNPIVPNPRRVGAAGAPTVDPREMLLTNAGLTPEIQAATVRRSFDKKVALLDAGTTKFFAHEGEVIDTREVGLPEVQLKAADSLDRMLGVNAPPSTRKVTVVHTLVWPEWYRRVDGEATTTITVEGEVA